MELLIFLLPFAPHSYLVGRGNSRGLIHQYPFQQVFRLWEVQYVGIVYQSRLFRSPSRRGGVESWRPGRWTGDELRWGGPVVAYQTRYRDLVGQITVWGIEKP